MKDVYSMNIQVKNNLNEISENKAKLKGLKIMQWCFTIATYAIYFSFTTVIFGGVSVWALQDYLFKNATNVIALVWVTTVVFIVPLALGLGKHYNYKSIADSFLARNNTGIIIHSMITLALISGIYYEAISSSANLQAKAFNAVNYQENLATILNSGNTVNTDPSLNTDIANAQMKLAQCNERLKNGKEKHCEGAKAKLKALKEQSQLVLSANASASANAVNAKADVLKSSLDEQTIPAAKWVAQVFKLSNEGGTMMIVIIAALFFELIHLTTVFSEIRTLINQNALKQTNEYLLNQYFNATGKVYNPNDFKDNRVIDLSTDTLKPVESESNEEGFKIVTKGNPGGKKPGFGFIPSPALTRFKWQEKPSENVKEEFSFGFVPKQGKVSTYTDNVQEVSTYTDNSPSPLVTPPTPRKISDLGIRVATRTEACSNTDEACSNTDVPCSNTVSSYTDKNSEFPQWSGREGHCKWCDALLNNDRKIFCNSEHKDKYWNFHKPAKSQKRLPRSNGK